MSERTHALTFARLDASQLWGTLFVGVNITKIGMLLNERRSVSFSDRELAAYELAFQAHGLTPRHFQRLLRVGTWVEVEEGEVLVAEGEDVDSVYVVAT